MIHKYTIKDFREEFPDDDTCLDKLFILNHAGNPCPGCTSINTYKRVTGRKCYQCSKCSHQLYPMKGTIYEKSTTPLTYWFYAIFLFVKSKNGLSAMELQRQLGVTYKTAYRMLKHIRISLVQDSIPFEGIIECDETFVGGKNKNRHADKKVKNSQGRSFKDKTPVLGMLERYGKVKAFVVPDTSATSIKPLLYDHIEQGSEVFTDEWGAYTGLKGYKHEVIYHAVGEYVNGRCTTNGIENFWSHLKRTIHGSYVHVTQKYLQLYVNEVVFRFNNRDNPAIFHDLLLASLRLS